MRKADGLSIGALRKSTALWSGSDSLGPFIASLPSVSRLRARAQPREPGASCACRFTIFKIALSPVHSEGEACWSPDVGSVRARISACRMMARAGLDGRLGSLLVAEAGFACRTCGVVPDDS